MFTLGRKCKKMARQDTQALRRIHRIVGVLCCVGIILSGYAYHVETKAEHEKSYQAMCDINKYISCTKTFTSRYGRGFGLINEDSIFNQPNSIFGIVFYILQLILGEINKSSAAQVQTVTSLISNLGSVYLAYVLVFILKHFCIVCVTMYVVNFLILMYNNKRWKIYKAKSAAGKKTN